MIAFGMGCNCSGPNAAEPSGGKQSISKVGRGLHDTGNPLPPTTDEDVLSQWEDADDYEILCR